MAGTFTHWMVVEEALDKYSTISDKQHPYFPTILENNHFIYLGAVSPDYPYLSDLILRKKHRWADRMHYENTGDFIRHGIQRLPGVIGDKNFDSCFSWLCGFASHLITDSVVHPVVQAIVGPYVFNSGEHRHCEMIQDSYIYNEIKNEDVSYAKEFVALLKLCSDPIGSDEKLNQGLCLFWKETLIASHPGIQSEQMEDIDPSKWHEAFLSRISMATRPVAIFRHCAEKKSLSYKKTNAITPDERRLFIDEIRLPGGKTGEFKKDVFDKTVEKVIETWDILFDLTEKGNPIGAYEYIKNWNLDTGVDEDNLYFWS